MQQTLETRVRSLGPKYPLDQEIAVHSDNSCLDNPMDSGAWRATVHGVTKRWIRVTEHVHADVCVEC